MKKRFSLSWLVFVSRRFANVDKKGRGALTSFLASLGIAFGVMTLITIISVMNGLQMSYIDSILEISSYHIRVKGSSTADLTDFISRTATDNEVLACTPFYEGQSLIAADRGRQSGALIHAVNPDICRKDTGFSKELKITDGSFDLSEPDYAVIGEDLAYELNVFIGDEITLVAVSGSSAVSLIDTGRIYKVSGIFTCGYSGINSSFVFVSDENKETLFGEDALPVVGLKLKDSASDSRYIAKASKAFSNLSFESWRSYNRAFFGALRIEKNMMMLLVLLIFVVVSVNIFNSLRRIVFERKDDIAVLSALGAKKNEIQAIFIMQGFLTGFTGAVPGTAAGLFLCINIDKILLLISRFSFHLKHGFFKVFAPGSVQYIDQSMMYNIFASVPPRIILSEVCLISIFGVFASLIAAWAASRGVLNLSCAEVLRDE